MAKKNYKTPKEVIQGAIRELKYLPNKPTVWGESFGGNKDKASMNGKKLKKLLDELAAILMEMPDPVTYTVCGLEEGDKSFSTREQLLEFMKKKGFSYSGDNVMNHRNRILQGQPTFIGMVGPMDGGGEVCYDTPELYDLLSR